MHDRRRRRSSGMWEASEERYTFWVVWLLLIRTLSMGGNDRVVSGTPDIVPSPTLGRTKAIGLSKDLRD